MYSLVVVSDDDTISLKLQAIHIQHEPSSSSMEHAILPFIVENDHEVALVDHITSTLLIRPRRVRGGRRNHASTTSSVDDDDPPLYAYHIPSSSSAASAASFSSQNPNRRATRLAMACGHWSYRFYGTVVLVTPGSISPTMWQNIKVICGYCGPDLRDSIIATLTSSSSLSITNDHDDDDATGTPTTAAATNRTNPSITNHCEISEWLGHAAQEQYQDRAIVQQFQQLFATGTNATTTNNNNSNNNDANVAAAGGTVVESRSTLSLAMESTTTPIHPTTRSSPSPTFCYTCRRPAMTLCSHCHGVYFCNADCRRNGWSHDCLCSIWKIYTDRRDTELANVFPSRLMENKNADHTKNETNNLWYEAITIPRECQLSSSPYLMFLSKKFNVNISDNCGILGSSSSWWNTEVDGWNFGHSVGASQIDLQRRRSYAQGFDPITDLPMEENIFGHTNLDPSEWTFNHIGLLQLSSWTEYYQLRQIPQSSPIALLMTYPLTLYYAILQYGTVPCTIAYQMEHRPLRIHIVGVEKELNFLDIYKELAYLLPVDFHVELVFCIRPDMIPTSLAAERYDHHPSQKMLFRVQLVATIHVSVVCGVYGDESSLHPTFDCGGGPPDMIMAYNAGLYAYESWRYMINYLYNPNTNAVGICTDYNEHSAVQCAAILGGITCQNSVIVNPFRQPRAMPVHSMNLPQYSNGFLYVVNEQSME